MTLEHSWSQEFPFFLRTCFTFQNCMFWARTLDYFFDKSKCSFVFCFAIVYQIIIKQICSVYIFCTIIMISFLNTCFKIFVAVWIKLGSAKRNFESKLIVTPIHKQCYVFFRGVGLQLFQFLLDLCSFL